MKKSLLSVAIASSLLIACSSEPMITDRDVLVAENHGELMTMYQQMQAKLTQTKPDSEHAENLKGYIAKVGEKIAKDKERIILNDLQRDMEMHDIATLEAALQRAEEIKTYDQQVYQGLRQELETAISKKKAIIANKEAEFNQVTDRKAPYKANLLEEIATIYGGTKAEEVRMQRTAYIDGLYQQALAALESKRHEDVDMLLNNLAEINPDYPGLQETRNKLVAAQYEQKFWDALGEGDTAKAYELFAKLTQIPNYLQDNPDVMPIAEDIAQYFIAEGNKQMGTYSISSAYRAYSRARYVRNVMGKGDVYTDGEQKFIAFIDKRLQKYADKNDIVPAYGYLSILEELQPENPSVLKYGQTINNAMLADATIKIIPSAFTEAQSKRSLGRGLVSKINQLVMETLPTRIQIIEAAALSEFSPSKVAEKINPTSFYFLSGEILEANVEQIEKPASVTKRVLTSYKRVENPEYLAWTKLSKREKKETPEPASTIEVPVEEDVTIKKTIIEKQGTFSITYRLAESLNASVAFSDAMTKKDAYSGESVEGIELGLFVQESKIADLPSDADILQKLSEEVAAEAATKITEQIESLEDNYLKKAEQAVIAENFNAATANYGYRYVLLQAQGKQNDDILQKLRQYAIRWK